MRPPETADQTTFARITRLIGLYVLAPLLLVLTLPMAVHISQGPFWGMQVHQLSIVSVTASGPAAEAGLQAGDRLLGINHRLLKTMTEYFVVETGQEAFDPCEFLIERDGVMQAVTIRPTRAPRYRMIWGYSLWAAGIAFLMMGVWVLWRRNDPLARNFFVLALIFAYFLAEPADFPSTLYITIKEVIRDLLVLLLPAFFLRFILHFPSEGPLSARQRRRHRLFLLPAIPLFLPSLYAQVASVDPGSSRLINALQLGVFIYFTVYFVAGLAVFARKILRRDRPIQHTKMRVVLFGLVAGLTPFFVGMFLQNFLPGSPLPHLEWLGFSLVLVPLSMGLAILRYGALDTAFVVRYSLTYGLLTLLLVATYFVVVGLMGHLLSDYLKISTESLATLTVAGSALAVLPVRRVVQGWIDQAFYPARRANRVAILKLAHELSGLIESQSAADTLLARLSSLYRPQRLSLFLRDKADENFRETAAVAEGRPIDPVFAVSRQSDFAAFMDRVRRPVFVEDLEEPAALRAEPRDPDSFMSRLGAELLIPLITGNKLSGFLAFGPKRSGDLYTQDDLTNLRLLCIQAAALLESQRLYQESLARKQLETELSVAKEIQAQLLPDDTLVLQDIRICGRMESSQEVGGDYYDYFPLDNQTIGFAIADVAGKGIPAALLMTTLRVTFHTEAVRSRQPEQVATRLNEAFCNLMAKGQFISFFYGVYSLADRQLRYCNAGMEPPLLFRRRQGYLESLRKGGPVLGVNPGQRYRCGTVRLQVGDLLVSYSDGVTEQTNADGEFFETERLIATVRDNLERQIEDLRETIFAAVSAFGGPVRSDDRTAMLFKVNNA